jgi:MoaA/NifB/PqqE/SkfB family radical SAM enzyme
MQVAHILKAWKRILAGRAPSLSIEVTRECPLHCPGCYAYEPNHLGAAGGLRQLSDFKGDDLVHQILDLVDRLQPLHVSLVGGDPLVRYREMEQVIPQLVDRGIHVQLVTSAFRPLPAHWATTKGLTVSVSIDGLPAEHDVRRAPATYERILKNIAGQRVTVHCTVTGQMVNRPGYLDSFAAFWNARPEVEKIWFSLFTPQIGAISEERLTKPQRVQVVAELRAIARKYPKTDLPSRLLDEFLRPPDSPDRCIFARTTETYSADFNTRITPCQFGGEPDCAECGCYASMGMAAIGAYRLGGVIPVGAIFRASSRLGGLRARSAPAPAGLVQIASGD